MNKMLLVALAVAVVGAVLVYFYTSSDQKTKQDHFENNIPTQDVIKTTQVDSTKKQVLDVQKYKDIFKEPKQPDRLKEFQEQEELRKIEQESQGLINEAEALIKKHNLTLPQRELTQEEKEGLDEFKNQMEDIKNQLEELKNENY
jgi:type IV secretory pathway VirB10-like protein